MTTINSKNAWELLMSSIACAFDGADTFVLNTFDESQNYNYKINVINEKTGKNINEHITEISFKLPNSADKIETVKAMFEIEDGNIENGDRIKITIIDSSESAQIELLAGKAKKISAVTNSILSTVISVEICDEIKFIYSKVIAEDFFLFDKYLSNNNQKENSILHIIAKKMGFRDEELNLEDARDSQSRLIKIPFMLLRKDNRYIDELQSILEVTGGRIYIDNLSQINFRNGLFSREEEIIYHFNKSNILSQVEENFIYSDKNGVKVIYDSYKYLKNQIVFNINKKIEIKENTTGENQKLEFNIKYITDLVVQHNLTKKTGYYYVNEEKIIVDLEENIHYKFTEFKESSAKVKFFNPYSTKFYIDNFEISGIPVAKYEENETTVKIDKNLDKNNENFSNLNKNKYIQTDELASDIAKIEFKKKCLDRREIRFKSNFVPHLEPGDVCSFEFKNKKINIKILAIEHELTRKNGCYSKIYAEEYDFIIQEFFYTKIESLNQKDSFLEELGNIKDKVDESNKNIDEIVKTNAACGYIGEVAPNLATPPISVKEPDVWFNPNTKEFKVWRNGKWNPAREEDIPPALMTALKAQAGFFRIGGNETNAGIFFQYDKDSKNPIFGTTDSENLAEVSIDKNANVLIRNANNKLALNIKDPERPGVRKTQILLDVVDSSAESEKNTIFKIGDSATGDFIEYKQGKLKMNCEAEITSSGSDETTMIRDGSITFTRNGIPITTFRNMRAGIISTDSAGSGTVEFTNMKTNLIVLATIKSFNITQNIRSLHCFAEIVDVAKNKWKFTIGGTESSSSGKNEDIYTFSFKKDCYSLSLSSVELGASQNKSFTNERSTGFRSLISNGKIKITIKYDDGLGNVKIVHEDILPVSLSHTYVETAMGNCGAVNPYPRMFFNMTAYVNNIFANISKTFSTFNMTTKTITLTVSYVNNSATFNYEICGRNESKIHYINNTFDKVNFKINYTTELVQNLTGSGEIQYLAIEQ